MSFMNPVDMVDEDAADLQFPKVALLHIFTTLNCLFAVEPLGPQVKRFIHAHQNEHTRNSMVLYNPHTLHRYLEEMEEKTRDQNSSVPSATKDANRCATCRCSLTEPYIKCSECLDTLLCLQCFSRGKEAFSHRNNHAYIIVRDNIQVFADEPHWTARDERILLKTLRTHGYGNWEAVSQALDQRHEPAEVRRHYHDCYFGGIFERLLNLKHARDSYVPERMPYVFKMRSLDPPRHDDIASMQFRLSAGYRCARGDFDTPYDTSAESLLSIMVDHRGRDDDNEASESEFEREVTEELQLGLVRAYNNRLRERQRRYKIMRQHGLIMPNRTVSWISKYVHAFGSDASCMRFLGFMQICPDPIKFDMLLESLRYYRELHSQLHKLYDLREHGVRTLSGAKLYARLSKERQQAQRDYSRLKQTDAFDWQQLVQHYESNRSGDPGPLAINSKLYVMNTRRKASPIEIGDLPGYSKLDDGERKLCSVARLVPQSYLDYKNQLVTEQAKLGYLRLADARRLIKIDVNKTRQIYDFLLEHGHISRPPSYG
uniref:Isoform E of Transcriptional adapter 2A n=1 Tax=Drosophila melanogaster TaxID=7227 RepID=Q7KSD8-4|nr:transcriptional adaptor 2a, isoform E [Drosophila melanogaster]AAX52963.1 transcriptional adaptor 2a, isoform E [Drosophila melanogaster]|eukprot:NP_001014634.1 transcriptional adaptor 2a, isoform E [Drosophila melanogaster]